MLDIIWRVIFVGSNFRGNSEKALKINFRGLKFRDMSTATSPGAWHFCTNDDVINTRTHDLLYY